MTVTLAPILTDLQAEGHSVKRWLVPFVGPEIARLEVDATPTFPAFTLDISVVSGDIADVRYDFLIEAQTADGKRKGWLNVNSTGTISSSTIPVRELSAGDVAIAAGDILIVRAYVPLVDRLPAADTTFAPNRIPYAGQNGALIPPIACSGGHYFAYLPLGTSVATFTGYGEDSYTARSSSPNTGTHLWTVLAGPADFASGSSATDENPVFESAAGESTILHEFTGDDNSVTWAQYVYVGIYDESSPPLDVEASGSLDIDEREGVGLTVELYEAVSRDRLPDGGLVALITREVIAGAEQSFGVVTGREHIKALGYVDQETLELSSAGVIAFDILSPQARTFRLPGFSKVATNVVLAADWAQFEGLTLEVLALAILRWYTTLTENIDVRFPDGILDVPYSKLTLSKMTPADQVNDLIESRGARMSCFAAGRVEIHQPPALMNAAARAAAPHNTLSSADWLKDSSHAPRITRMHTRPLSMYKMSGITAGTSGQTSVYSIYPGKATGRGAKVQTYDKAISVNQAESDEQCGLRGALEDGVYIDPDTGEMERAYEWELSLPGSYHVFEIDGSFLDFADSPDNLRDLDVTRLSHWIKHITVTYEGGTSVVTLTLMSETYASAETDDPPPVVSVPPYTPPGKTPKPPGAKPGKIPPASGVLPTRGVILSYDSPLIGLATGFDLDNALIVYANRSSGVNNNHFTWGYSNPWAYSQLLGAGDVGIESTLNIEAGGAYTLHKSNAAIWGSGAKAHRLGGTINRNGFHWGISGSNAVARSLDGWGNVGLVSIDGRTADPGDATGADNYCDVCAVERSAGHFYGIAPSVLDPIQPALYRSTDYCATWTQVGELDAIGQYNTIGRVTLEIPYTRIDGSTPNVDDDDLQIYLHISGLGAVKTVTYLTSRTLAFEFGYFVGGLTSAVDATHPVSTFTHGGQHVWFADDANIRYSDDALATPAATQFTFSPGSGFNVNTFSPNPNVVVGYSRTAGIGVSMDGVNFFGNVPDFFPASPLAIAYFELSLYPLIGT